MDSTYPPRSGSKLLKFFKVVFFTIALLIIAFVAVGMFVLKGDYDLSREITIKASPDAIHAQVGDLQQWPNWLPFTKHDKSVKTEIKQATGVGANQSWTGDGGNGELEFKSSDPQKGIDYDMVFDKKWKSHGSIHYSPAGDSTKVTWRMHGKNDDFVGKWFALAMPAMVGPMFEEGLVDLKNKVEGKKDEPKKDEAKKDEPKKDESKKDEAKKDDKK